LASDELFLLDIRNGEDKAQWMMVPVVGTTPGRRYGHTLVYFKPNLLIFGGNNGTDAVNDVWLLNVEKAPFTWAKLDIAGELPPGRTYHSASLCTSGTATGMIVIFGGRGYDQSPLNDGWGLRKHRDGHWDWVMAPYKPHSEVPLKRYQHCGIFIGTLLFIVGGRTSQQSEPIGLEIYDTETSEWYKYNVARRFRHASWSINTSLFLYGGFDYDAQMVPKNELVRVDLSLLFEGNKILLTKILNHIDPEDQFIIDRAPGTPVMSGQNLSAVKPTMTILEKKRIEAMAMTDIETQVSETKTGEKAFRLASTAVIALPRNTKESSAPLFKSVPLRSIAEESKLIFAEMKDTKLTRQPTGPDSIHDVFIKQLLKPKDWETQQYTNTHFSFRKEFIIELTDQCIKIVQQQPIVLRVRAPIKVFGDVHGQYQDLMRFFDLWGTPSNDITGDIEAYDYLFLGDYVDRGSHSLETMCLLMALKVKYPDQIHLLRGNHEDRWINGVFGFSEECSIRLNEDCNEPDSVFQKINDLFDWLPLAAIIEDKIICLHGGIGSVLSDVKQIEALKRPLEVVHEVKNDIQQLIVDILWSDPTDTDEDLGIHENYIRDPNSTGNIVKFGPDKVEEFLIRNKLLMILRAHECVMDGFERFAAGALITVFSATDYCGRHKNAGAVLFITRRFEIIPKLIYPMDNPGNNWMTESTTTTGKRPPTPPRWNTAQFTRSNSFK